MWRTYNRLYSAPAKKKKKNKKKTVKSIDQIAAEAVWCSYIQVEGSYIIPRERAISVQTHRTGTRGGCRCCCPFICFLILYIFAFRERGQKVSLFLLFVYFISVVDVYGTNHDTDTTDFPYTFFISYFRFYYFCAALFLFLFFLKEEEKHVFSYFFWVRERANGWHEREETKDVLSEFCRLFFSFRRF